MILILPVPIFSTSITLRENGVSLLNLPRIVSEYSRSLEAVWSEPQKKGNQAD